MYCHNCGRQIDDSSKYCPHCGAKQERGQEAGGESQTEKKDFYSGSGPRPGYAEGGRSYSNYYSRETPENNFEKKFTEEAKNYNVMCIISLVVSIVSLGRPIVGIVGIVLAIISMRKVRASGEKGKGLAVTALVISILTTVLFVLGLIFMFIYPLGIMNDIVREFMHDSGHIIYHIV